MKIIKIFWRPHDKRNVRAFAHLEIEVYFPACVCHYLKFAMDSRYYAMVRREWLNSGQLVSSSVSSLS